MHDTLDKASQVTLTAERLRESLQKLENIHNTRKYEDQQHTIGRILTVTDGMIADPEQRKAVKDLVRNAFYGNYAPAFDRNNSLEAQLFKHMTGENLWDDPPLLNASVTDQHNIFDN